MSQLTSDVNCSPAGVKDQAWKAMYTIVAILTKQLAEFLKQFQNNQFLCHNWSYDILFSDILFMLKNEHVCMLRDCN
ncbi:hypothetical protein DSO57_1028524 [Entomophthora muscae]|uniref:Uncharacterized protein n=1 Tax=Entomophthora muscae TaxID=34485 RepID=A0ACC2T1P0_9FUNG|nr:hypothetical protein DSO57_1028524 [Entomophthora muscae]